MFNRFLGGLGKTLISAGLIILAFVAFQLWGTGLEEQRQQEDLTQELAKSLATPAPTVPGATGTTLPGATTTAAPQVLGSKVPGNVDEVMENLSAIDPATVGPIALPEEGAPMGVIEIPKIGLRRTVVQGVNKGDLRRGPGHYETTAFPGQKGNAGIAGHRTTYGAPFHRIDELVPGDLVYVLTRQGKFTYEVMPAPADATNRGSAYWIVRPDNSDVLADKGDNRLTLTACHPKYSAAKRIIVAAKLVNTPAPSAPPTTLAPGVTTTVPDVGAAPEEPAADILDQGLSGDPKELRPAVQWGLGAFGVWFVAWLIGFKFRRWACYLLAAPPFIYLLWMCFTHVDKWLPSL